MNVRQLKQLLSVMDDDRKVIIPSRRAYSFEFLREATCAEILYLNELKMFSEECFLSENHPYHKEKVVILKS